MIIFILLYSTLLQLNKILSAAEQKAVIKERKLDLIWQILCKYKEWNGLMGCSIQQDAKENLKPEVRQG